MIDEHVRARLNFMGIGEDQRMTLAKVKPMIASMIGGGLDHFYTNARATPETAAFFRDEQHMMKAKAAQEAHWMRIASGNFDEEFHSSVRRIGSVHARIGLEPRWYVGAYALVLEKLLHGVAKRCSPWRRLLSMFRIPAAREASVAVVKAALLDLEMSISIYFEQAEIERNQAIATLGQAIQSMAEGDLVTDLSGLPTNFAALEGSFNEALASMRQMIGGVTQSADGIRTGSAEIAQASEDLARRTESNAASLEETSAALAQIDTRLRATALSSAQTVARADQAIATVGGGRSTAVEAVSAMGRVSDSAKGIDSVIEGLDKIAFQTRVLAMNAAVEAGRAGDAGRGFAVVADLVSALAMRAEEEAKRARDQLTVTQTDIVTAVQAVQKVDGALANISSDVDEVHKLLGTMANDATAQSSAITQITAAIGSMDQSTQQNAAMVEETSAAARNLTAEVASLAEQTAMFKTNNAPPARRAPPARATSAPPQAAKPRAAAPVYQSPVKAMPALAAADAGSDDWNAFDRQNAPIGDRIACAGRAGRADRACLGSAARPARARQHSDHARDPRRFGRDLSLGDRRWRAADCAGPLSGVDRRARITCSAIASCPFSRRAADHGAVHRLRIDTIGATPMKTIDLAYLRLTGMRLLAGLTVALACVVVLTALLAAAPGKLPAAVIAVLLAVLPCMMAVRGRIDAQARMLASITVVVMPALLIFAAEGRVWQVDLHMIFFALLAVVSILCDWKAICAAAAVVAVHHLGFGLLLPDWIFTGGGSIGRVALHAVILVVEAATLMWVAERIVALIAAIEAGNAERERAEAALAAERARQAASVAIVTTSLGTALAALTDGDLTADIAIDYPGDYATLKTNFNQALAGMRRLIGSVSNSASGIRETSAEIARASEDLARRTESNAASLEETSAALAQVDARHQGDHASCHQHRCARRPGDRDGRGRARNGRRRGVGDGPRQR